MQKKAILIFSALAMASSMSAKANSYQGINWTSYGADSHPGYVITWNGSYATIVHDTTIGPYDGNDDTYIGIINTGSTPLYSINLSAPLGNGGGIFAFDGDGIDSYGAPGNSIDQGVYGTGAYGGPQSYFSNIGPTDTNGTVNFIGGIAGNGGYTFFSLENDLTTVSGGQSGGLSVNGVPEGGSTIGLISIAFGACVLGIRRHRFVN